MTAPFRIIDASRFLGHRYQPASPFVESFLLTPPQMTDKSAVRREACCSAVRVLYRMTSSQSKRDQQMRSLLRGW